MAHHRPRLVLAAMAAVLALTLTACGGGGGGTGGGGSGGGGTTAPPAAGSAITIHNFAFSPTVLTVKPGAKVSVTNLDSVTHTLTSTTGAFNTGNVGPNQTVTFTAPTKPGTYPYICQIHQYMTGTLKVS